MRRRIMQRSGTPVPNPPDRQPLIGVLDSGVGGLSVLREIHRLLPAHPTLYVADQAHLPYGTRSKTDIFAFVDAIATAMMAQGARAIVLACNAASAASLHALRDHYPGFPFVGIEPAVKPAAETTRSGVIGVLTTQATADGDLFRATISRFASHVQVITQPAPALVHLVESGEWDTEAARQVMHAELDPLLAAGADQIALACTHFPFLIEPLSQIAGNRAAFIDPGPAVARQLVRVLAAAGFSSDQTGLPPQHRYVTSGDPARLGAMIQRLLGLETTVEQAVWMQSGLSL
ncbi:MAG: glutamate racemase [bacterium]|nr:glutamate racemase [bacterium]